MQGSPRPGAGGHRRKATGAASRGPPKTARSFATTLLAFVDPGLEKFLIDNHVEISARPMEEERNPLLTLLLGFGPALLK
jgi:cell division protease FtsH